jgi:hypothetical protein
LKCWIPVMTDCSRVRTLLNFEGKVGERWLATGCFSKEAMSRSDLRGGGDYVVCVCVCASGRGRFRVAIRFFFFVFCTAG